MDQTTKKFDGQNVSSDSETWKSKNEYLKYAKSWQFCTNSIIVISTGNYHNNNLFL